MKRLAIFIVANAAASIAACAHSSVTPAITPSVTPAGAAPAAPRHPGQPPAAPAKWMGLLGEYDAPAGMRIVLEDGL